jgi:aconitase A
MPSPWLKMIRLSAGIYKKLTPAQKIKLVDMGVLPPDFERELLIIFSNYLVDIETTQKTTEQTPLKTVLEKKKKEDSPCKQFHKTLKMIKPDDLRINSNQYSGFLNMIRDLMRENHPNIKLSISREVFPNYPDLYDEWRKIHKILK